MPIKSLVLLRYNVLELLDFGGFVLHVRDKAQDEPPGQFISPSPNVSKLWVFLFYVKVRPPAFVHKPHRCKRFYKFSVQLGHF